MRISACGTRSRIVGAAWEAAAAAAPRANACSCERITFCAAETSAARPGAANATSRVTSRTTARITMLPVDAYSYVLHPRPGFGMPNQIAWLVHGYYRIDPPRFSISGDGLAGNRR